MPDVARLVAGKRLANSLDLVANSCKLSQHGVDKGAVLVELGQSGVSDAIELLAAFRFDRCVADLFQLRDCRIHHTRTRRIETPRGFFKGLDNLVPMPWALLEQSQ